MFDGDGQSSGGDEAAELAGEAAVDESASNVSLSGSMRRLAVDDDGDHVCHR